MNCWKQMTVPQLQQFCKNNKLITKKRKKTALIDYILEKSKTQSLKLEGQPLAVDNTDQDNEQQSQAYTGQHNHPESQTCPTNCPGRSTNT